MVGVFVGVRVGVKVPVRVGVRVGVGVGSDWQYCAPIVSRISLKSAAVLAMKKLSPSMFSVAATPVLAEPF
jgi:hypothetical protein